MEHCYSLKETSEIISPALIYYRDILVDNTRKAIAAAGSAKRLWPHVKSHKSSDFIRLQMELGINRFKCATVAEAEMLAQVGAGHILLAYPLVGPNIKRYASLAKAYPALQFYAIGDDYGQLEQLSQECARHALVLPVLLDVNMGMNRTGAIFSRVEELYQRCAALPGIRMAGLHCYDGHHHMADPQERQQAVDAADELILRIRKNLQNLGMDCGIIIAGGSPSMPCHAAKTDWFLSPGTLFIHDYTYLSRMPEMDFVPGAVLFTRVVSHPDKGLFTLDLGHKGIAADPVGQRGIIVGLEEAKPVLQSEEHWVFSLGEDKIPPIGAGLYVIPAHICPTSALYPSLLVAQGGEIVAEWPVTARNRKLTY